MDQAENGNSASRPRWTSPAAWPPTNCSRRSCRLRWPRPSKNRPGKHSPRRSASGRPIDKEKLPEAAGHRIVATHFTDLESVKTPATLICQGTQAGERVIVEFEVKGVHLTTLDDIGMRPKMQEQLNEVLNRKRGHGHLVGVARRRFTDDDQGRAPNLDRFVREFSAVEDEGNRYDETENIPVTTYNRAAGQSPADVLVRVFRQQPNVVVVRDLVNAATREIDLRRDRRRRAH